MCKFSAILKNNKIVAKRRGSEKEREREKTLFFDLLSFMCV